jgi:hypothetical protein
LVRQENVPGPKIWKNRHIRRYFRIFLGNSEPKQHSSTPYTSLLFRPRIARRDRIWSRVKDFAMGDVLDVYDKMKFRLEHEITCNPERTNPDFPSVIQIETTDFVTNIKLSWISNYGCSIEGIPPTPSLVYNPSTEFVFLTSSQQFGLQFNLKEFNCGSSGKFFNLSRVEPQLPYIVFMSPAQRLRCPVYDEKQCVGQ